MKRIITVLFAAIYLLLAMGVNVNAHWCGKKIRFVSFAAPHEKKCPCGKKMNPGCCKDVHAYFKITDTQKAASKIVLPPNSFSTITAAVSEQHETIYQRVDVFDITSYHAPPFKTKLPVYLAGSVLRV